MQQVTVVGAGVSGLSSGIRLLEAGFEVQMITRELPPETTSAAAGAVWWGYLDGRRRAWALVSLKVFQRLAENPDSGVLQIQLRDVYPHPVADPWFKGELPACGRIPPGQLPPGSADGFLMTVPLVETPRYLRFLLAWFERLGGRIEQREITSLSDLYADHRLIVNCTGVGARQAVNDPAVYPIRGQVVRVNAPSITQGYMDDEAFTYIFPRGDGVVLGGVAQPDNWSREVDPAIAEDILRRTAVIEPVVRGAPIAAHSVGLRPGRHEVRLECERVSDTGAVIHNYGHAGVGYTLSWGCAAEVAALADGLDK
jgi:D-amino-acid oxidase